MLQKNTVRYSLSFCYSVFFLFILSACSTRQNTSFSRSYHSFNTRYNVHFNANEAYKEALIAKQATLEDNLSYMLSIYPNNADSSKQVTNNISFAIPIEKATKAIREHSIRTKPKQDASKRNNAEYQAWVQQREYNPFLINSWLLLAKAQSENGDYLQSIATSLYTMKIYSTNPQLIAESQLRIAKAYTEMGWMYEAENTLHKIDLAGEVPPEQKSLYSAVYANYLVQAGNYEKAIPLLAHAIKGEKQSHQKMRMKYLLGQLYTQVGDKANASKAFASVKGMTTPYHYTFNASLHQIELDELSSKKEIVGRLKKMAKPTRNKSYLDQIYYSLGTLYLQQQDTIQAIDNYKQAIKESTRNGYDKALAQITLGGIYFEQRAYILAQPCYSEALAQLKKTDKQYPLVSLRADVLDELAVHATTVYEQDSLQHLAQLPEKERMLVITNKIALLKKEESEKQKAEEQRKRVEERDERVVSWGNLAEQTAPNEDTSPSEANSTSFYFYQDKIVAQGKIAFQKRWGNLKLEDDWRRKNKSLSTFDSFAEIRTEDDNAAQENSKESQNKEEFTDKTGTEEKNGDIYPTTYYLQQIPLTEKSLEESNTLIDNALFNMGGIYRSKLYDIELATESFETAVIRFPQSTHLEEIYYQLFLIYMQQGNTDKMTMYRSRLLDQFKNGIYAVPLSQPNYEHNLRYMAVSQDSIYNASYKAYITNDTSTVRANYLSISTTYPSVELMPQFMLLDALTYAQTKEVNKLRDKLKTLVDTYPKAEVSPFATDILTRIKDGQILLSDGSPITGLDWSAAFEGDSVLLAQESLKQQFSDEVDTKYLLLLVSKNTLLDRNELLYQVADYNFSNYLVHTFDLLFEEKEPFEILQIKGFETLSILQSYLNRAFSDSSLVSHLPSTVSLVPISELNYSLLSKQKTINEYITFFASNPSLNNRFPQLANYWAAKEDLNNIQIPIPPIVENGLDAQEPKDQLAIVPSIDNPKPPTTMPPKGEKVETENMEVKASDILSDKQLDIVNKVADINTTVDKTINASLEATEAIISNPVDGIKNLFSKFKNREKLTKEEKAERKAQEKQEKEQLKTQRAIAKAYNDSLAQVQIAVQDSIQKIEEQKLKEQERIEQEKKDAIKLAAKTKKDLQLQKEQERKTKLRLQKEKLQQQKDKRKEQDRLRKENLRKREQEQKEKAKIKEQERKRQT